MEVTSRARVGANVRAEMARRQLNQTWLADLLGLSQQSVSRRLTGRVAFDVDELDKVADALGTSVTDLIGARVEPVAS